MCSFHCAHTPGAAGLFRALRSIRPATRLFRIRSIRRFFVRHRLCARFTARIRLVRLGYFALCAQYAPPRAYFAFAQYGAFCVAPAMCSFHCAHTPGAAKRQSTIPCRLF